MTMREFVEIANKTFQILKENDDLDATIEWKSYNIDAPSYLPPNPVSSDDMLEIDARVAQCLILSRNKMTDDAREKFFESLFDGDCGRDCGIKLKSLMVTLHNLINVRFAIDVAINTPIDLACSSKFPILYVEDVLPPWRLCRIQSAFMQNNKLVNLFTHLQKNNEIIRKSLWEEIAKLSQIPTPKMTLEAVGSSLILGKGCERDSHILQL